MSTDPGIALSWITVAAAMVALVAFVTARFRSVRKARTQDPTREPSQGRRLGVVLGLAGLGLVVAAIGRKGAATAFVTGVIGDDGGLFEADLVRTGADAVAGPWRPTHVDVFHCRPGQPPPPIPGPP